MKLKRFQRKSRTEIMLHCFMSALFAVVAASYLYMFLWMIIAGLKEHTDLIMNPFGLPSTWKWSNYLEVFTDLEVNGNNFFHMLFNSVWFSVLGTFTAQFFSLTLAYAATKYTFPGSKYIYPIILVMSTLPLYGTGGAAYKLMNDLGLIDNYAQVFFPQVFGFGVLYYVSFVKNLSWSYAEAAMMDGAGDFAIFFRVMFPQMKPIFGALFLSSWVTSWNSYEGAMLYLPNLPTLPVGIYQFNIEMTARMRLDLLFAACVLVCLPSIILFAVFNKTMTSSVSIGGLKG